MTVNEMEKVERKDNNRLFRLIKEKGNKLFSTHWDITNIFLLLTISNAQFI